MAARKVIVVEDDADLRTQVVDFLKLSGFDASGAGCASDFYRRMAVETFTITVLDLHLPDEDGLSIASHVRGLQNMGIIMMTARGKSEDRIRGFDAGADVYLPKPVDLHELAAAARSLARRLEERPRVPTEAADSPPSPAPSISLPPWRCDPTRFALIAPNGRSVNLTVKEVAILMRLTAACGGVVSRGDLLGAIGYSPNDPTNRNLDAALRRLRLKVSEETTMSFPIRTVHGVGYRLTEDVAMASPSEG